MRRRAKASCAVLLLALVQTARTQDSALEGYRVIPDSYRDGTADIVSHETRSNSGFTSEACAKLCTATARCQSFVFGAQFITSHSLTRRTTVTGLCELWTLRCAPLLILQGISLPPF